MCDVYILGSVNVTVIMQASEFGTLVPRANDCSARRKTNSLPIRELREFERGTGVPLVTLVTND